MQINLLKYEKHHPKQKTIVHCYVGGHGEKEKRERDFVREQITLGLLSELHWGFDPTDWRSQHIVWE